MRFESVNQSTHLIAVTLFPSAQAIESTQAKLLWVPDLGVDCRRSTRHAMYAMCKLRRLAFTINSQHQPVYLTIITSMLSKCDVPYPHTMLLVSTRKHEIFVLSFVLLHLQRT